jgi:hypothetical protein
LNNWPDDNPFNKIIILDKYNYNFEQQYLYNFIDCITYTNNKNNKFKSSKTYNDLIQKVLHIFFYYNKFDPMEALKYACKIGSLYVYMYIIKEIKIIPDKICLLNIVQNIKSKDSMLILTDILNHKILPDRDVFYKLNDYKSVLIELLISHGLNITLDMVEHALANNCYICDLSRFNIKYDDKLYYLCYKYIMVKPIVKKLPKSLYKGKGNGKGKLIQRRPEGYKFDVTFNKHYENEFKKNIDTKKLLLRKMCSDKQNSKNDIFTFAQNNNVKFDGYCVDIASKNQHSITKVFIDVYKCDPTIGYIYYNYPCFDNDVYQKIISRYENSYTLNKEYDLINC